MSRLSSNQATKVKLKKSAAMHCLMMKMMKKRLERSQPSTTLSKTRSRKKTKKGAKWVKKRRMMWQPR